MRHSRSRHPAPQAPKHGKPRQLTRHLGRLSQVWRRSPRDVERPQHVDAEDVKHLLRANAATPAVSRLPSHSTAVNGWIWVVTEISPPLLNGPLQYIPRAVHNVCDATVDGARLLKGGGQRSVVAGHVQVEHGRARGFERAELEDAAGCGYDVMAP